MIRESQRPWERMIRDLHHGFSLLDQEIALLRKIDQTILGIDGEGTSEPLESVFLHSIERFSRIHRTNAPLLCYVYLGSELVLLQKGGERAAPEHTSRIGLSTAVKQLLNESEAHRGPLLLESDEEDQLFEHFPTARTILLWPMYRSSKLSDLLSVFLVTDDQSRMGSHLDDDEFKGSLGGLISQLTIAYEHRERALQHQRLNELWDTFLGYNLSPSQCLKHLAEKVGCFLPTFGPLKFSGPRPAVQILTVVRSTDTDEPQHLLIRGTTGEEHNATRIAIDNSICGLLVEDETLSYFCDDPSKPMYHGRYRNYQHKAIKTELAVRLQGADKLVGVLNVESEVSEAFNVHHKSAVLALADLITPIVSVFENRLALNSAMQYSVTSSTARYLEGLASIFRHGIGTPLASFRSNLDLSSALVAADAKKSLDKARQAASAGDSAALNVALEQTDEKLAKTESALARLLSVHKQISEYTKVFASDIGSYGETGAKDLRLILDETVQLATNSLLAKVGNNIRIAFAKDGAPPATKVFCSTLLKQHAYNILYNAILSIQDRLENDPTPGVIAISIEKDVPPKTEEVRLNESWAVRIRDNGNGVTSEQLEKLKRFQPGTHLRPGPGQGYALTAAQRYLASIGGRIDLDSESGKFFEVTMHLDEYRPNLHAGRTIEGT